MIQVWRGRWPQCLVLKLFWIHIEGVHVLTAWTRQMKTSPKLAKLSVHITESKQTAKNVKTTKRFKLQMILNDQKKCPILAGLLCSMDLFTYFSTKDLKRYDNNINNNSVRLSNILSKFLGWNFIEIGSMEIRFFPIFTATIKTITTTIKKANIRVYVWIIWKSVSSIIPEQIA